MPTYRLTPSARPRDPAAAVSRRPVNSWRRLAACAAIIAATAAGAEPAPAAHVTPFKVYISVDMEGVAGVVTADQLSPAGFEYERFRRFMTDEALAAVRAAKQAGATEIVVSDSHANGENLLIDLFPNDVRIVRSWPRHGAMMAGLDKSFAAAIFVGYHSSTSPTASSIRRDSRWSMRSSGSCERRERRS